MLGPSSLDIDRRLEGKVVDGVGKLFDDKGKFSSDGEDKFLLITFVSVLFGGLGFVVGWLSDVDDKVSGTVDSTISGMGEATISRVGEWISTSIFEVSTSSWIRDGEGEESAAISDVPREPQMPVEYIGVYV